MDVVDLGNNHLYDALERGIAQTIRSLKRAGFHGGFEYVASPSRTVRENSEAALQAGATLVINHHPHVVGGFRLTQVRGRDLEAAATRSEATLDLASDAAAGAIFQLPAEWVLGELRPGHGASVRLRRDILWTGAFEDEVVGAEFPDGAPFGRSAAPVRLWATPSRSTVVPESGSGAPRSAQSRRPSPTRGGWS